MKSGDLIKMKDGRFATVVSDVYKYRFMDPEDHDMVANGMGEYAGSYGGAIDVLFMSTGIRRRLRVGDRNFEVIKEK